MRMRHLGADAATPPPTPALERIAGELLLQIRRDSRTGTRLGQKTAEVEDVAAGEADEGVARLGQREGEDVVVLGGGEREGRVAARAVAWGRFGGAGRFWVCWGGVGEGRAG